MMDAKLKKIQITPVKFNKEGDVQKEEFATLTFDFDSYPFATEGIK